MSKYKTKKDKIKIQTKSEELCPTNLRGIIDVGCEQKPTQSEPGVLGVIFAWLLILVLLAASIFVLFGYGIAIFDRELFNAIFPRAGGIFFYPIGATVWLVTWMVLNGKTKDLFK